VRSARAGFVNSGILGHATVARILRLAVAGAGWPDAEHLDLSGGLGPGERLLRRALCGGPRPGGSAIGALTLPRLRHELHAGIAARRRIRAAERAGGRFDVLHFHPQATAYASLGRMVRTPSLVSLDLTQRLAARQLPSALRRLDHVTNAALDRAVFRRGRALVVTSRWAAEDLLDDLPALEGRVHVMPYPVALHGFEADRWARARAARNTGAPVRVLFMGGDWERKGGPTLLEAWRRLDAGNAAKLTLVTDARVRDTLPRGVERRGGVRAYTPEWFGLWRDADLFVLPTRSEAFGMVLQESAAAGLPAVSTTVGAVPEIVADGETGLLVPPSDPDALGEALGRLIASRELRGRLGSAARERVERTASLEAYGRRLTALLRGALDA
jgi:alpha-maltose-1-phosphate synthase